MHLDTVHGVSTDRVPGAARTPEVEVRRSTRRRRTVSAYRDGDRVVVLVPARLSRAQERDWVATMVARLEAGERRRRPGDEQLQRRAAALSQRWLDGRASPASVRWSVNQERRWGSCTPGTGDIRLSGRLRGQPTWVVDYVLVHELAHLLVPDHSAAFWELVERYPRAERARGFLLGVAHAEGSGGEDPETPDDLISTTGAGTGTAMAAVCG